MRCAFGLNYVNKLPSQTIVSGYCTEGEYQDITNPITEEVTNQYIANNIFDTFIFTFNFSLADKNQMDELINGQCKKELDGLKGDRIPVPECVL